MYILRLEVKQHVSALYGHHQVFFFSLKVSLYKGKEKTYDGHIRPKHVVLLLILEYISFI